MALPQSGPHPNAVDMSGLPQVWREILSNARDWVIVQNLHRPITLDVSAGGTFTLTIDQQYAGSLIRLTGTPAGAFNVDVLDCNHHTAFENTSGQTATIDTVTGATSPVTLLTNETRILHIRGIEITTTARVGLQLGAMLHDGAVSPTAAIDFADFELKKAELRDVSMTVTSPSSSAGTLILDSEPGNVFDVTLTEAVTTVNLNNPPPTGKVGAIVVILRQDSTGGWALTWPSSVKWGKTFTSKLLLEDGISFLLLENGTDKLLLEPLNADEQTLAPDAVDIYLLKTFDAGSTWYATIAGLNMG